MRLKEEGSSEAEWNRNGARIMLIDIQAMFNEARPSISLNIDSNVPQRQLSRVQDEGNNNRDKARVHYDQGAL